MNHLKNNFQVQKMNNSAINYLFKNLTLIALFLLASTLSLAQESTKNQAYLIHEDRVKPAMIEEYEQIAKDLVSACQMHNIQELNWITVAQDDHTYLYLTPMDKFADLDVNSFTSLSEKMGKDEMGNLFKRFNKCYDEHGDYIVYLSNEYSYMPNGLKIATKGQDYRTFYYNHVTPENNENFIEVVKKIKTLFTKMNSKLDYRVYKSGFGIMGTYYLVVLSGENAEQSAKARSDNWELLHNEFATLLKEMRKYTWKSYEKTGRIRSELSYVPIK